MFWSDSVFDNKFINDYQKNHDWKVYFPKTPINKTIFGLSIFKNTPNLHLNFYIKNLLTK